MGKTQTHGLAGVRDIGHGISVRGAIPTDAASWLKMRCALWPEASAESRRREIAAFFAGEAAEPDAAFLAFDAHGAAVGFTELSIRPSAEGCESSRVAYLEGWYVERDSRLNGVGRALIWAAENWAQSRGCSELASDAPLDAHASAHAHEAVGFSEVGQLRCYRKTL